MQSIQPLAGLTRKLLFFWIFISFASTQYSYAAPTELKSHLGFCDLTLQFEDQTDSAEACTHRVKSIELGTDAGDEETLLFHVVPNERLLKQFQNRENHHGVNQNEGETISLRVKHVELRNYLFGFFSHLPSNHMIWAHITANPHRKNQYHSSPYREIILIQALKRMDLNSESTRVDIFKEFIENNITGKLLHFQNSIVSQAKQRILNLSPEELLTQLKILDEELKTFHLRPFYAAPESIHALIPPLHLFNIWNKIQDYSLNWDTSDAEHLRRIWIRLEMENIVASRIEIAMKMLKRKISQRYFDLRSEKFKNLSLEQDCRSAQF